MLIKSIDEKGNKTIGNFPDDSQFIIEDSSEGSFYIAAHLPRPVPSSVLPVQRVVSGLSKEIANSCIDKIYEQLKANEKDCDLTDIQQGTFDSSEEDNNGTAS